MPPGLRISRAEVFGAQVLWEIQALPLWRSFRIRAEEAGYRTPEINKSNPADTSLFQSGPLYSLYSPPALSPKLLGIILYFLYSPRP